MGNTNSQIIDTLIKSVIVNSFDEDFIAFDTETSEHLLALKKFNYRRIYTDEKVKKSNSIIYRTMPILFDIYLNDIKRTIANPRYLSIFWIIKIPKYLDNYSPAERVRDFIATMTDPLLQRRN